MKIKCIMLAALMFYSAPGWSTFQEREYNTWYIKNAVLYDMTQTSEGFPVMVSVSQPGKKSANLVVSYITEGQCGKNTLPLQCPGDASEFRFHPSPAKRYQDLGRKYQIAEIRSDTAFLKSCYACLWYQEHEHEEQR